MTAIEEALARCDLFVAIGTSGNVYPAAGFHSLARQAGAHTVEINLEGTGSGFDEQILGPASSVVPDFFSAITR
jgi:NAD-dependent deacetylase